MSHWSSGLPVCFLSQGTQVQNPCEDLCETGILLLALSRYIGDPNVIDNFCGLVWGGLHPEPSLGPRADNVIIPLDLTQLFCPGFTLTAGPPSCFTTNGVGCWGGALWRACNLTSFSPCLTGPVDYPFASCHKGPGFKTSVLMWNQDSPVSVSLQVKICLQFQRGMSPPRPFNHTLSGKTNLVKQLITTHKYIFCSIFFLLSAYL